MTTTPDFIQNVLRLLQAALTWLLVLIPAAAGAAIAYHALMKQMNEGDQGEAAQHNKAIKNILIAAAIGISAAAIVTAILGFFTVPPATTPTTPTTPTTSPIPPT